MSIHLYSFRQGDRSEYLAQYMLSALGLAVKVPREEDIGIDFHCTLASHIGPVVQYFAPYNVQVKSSSVQDIVYGGADKKGNWKEHQVRWLLRQQVPFFIAIVDKATGKMDIFSTATRWFAVHSGFVPWQIVLRPYSPDPGVNIGEGTKTDIPDVTCPTGLPISWEIPLGPPALSLTWDSVEDQSFLLSARNYFKDYIALDQRNAVGAATGLQHWYWPLLIATNQTLMARGIATAWPPSPDNHTKDQLRALAPLVATLLRTYESANDADKVQKLAPLLDLLPQEVELDLPRRIIEDGIAMQAEKHS